MADPGGLVEDDATAPGADVLPPGALGRGRQRAGAAARRGRHDRRHRAALPRAGADHGRPAHPRQAQDRHRRHPLRRARRGRPAGAARHRGADRLPRLHRRLRARQRARPGARRAGRRGRAAGAGHPRPVPRRAGAAGAARAAAAPALAPRRPGRRRRSARAAARPGPLPVAPRRGRRGARRCWAGCRRTPPPRSPRATGCRRSWRPSTRRRQRHPTPVGTVICAHYAQLVALNPSPAVRLAAAVALAERDGPHAGLAALDDLDAALPHSHRLPAVRGELLGPGR